MHQHRLAQHLEHYRIPEPRVSISPDGFLACPLWLMQGMTMEQLVWQHEIYQLAFALTQAELRPSLPEREAAARLLPSARATAVALHGRRSARQVRPGRRREGPRSGCTRSRAATSSASAGHPRRPASAALRPRALPTRRSRAIRRTYPTSARKVGRGRTPRKTQGQRESQMDNVSRRPRCWTLAFNAGP